MLLCCAELCGPGGKRRGKVVALEVRSSCLALSGRPEFNAVLSTYAWGLHTQQESKTLLRELAWLHGARGAKQAVSLLGMPCTTSTPTRRSITLKKGVVSKE